MRRIVYRGKKTTFRADFFEDDAKTLPLTPASSNYPEYTIFDSAGLSILTGVGALDTSPGYYKVDWTPVMASALSSDTAKWRIEWLIVTADGNSITFVDTFDVIDETVSASESLAQQILAVASSEIRVPLRLTSEYNELILTIYTAGTNAVAYGPKKYSMGVIKKIEDGDSYVYYLDLPANTLIADKTYTAMWEVRRTPASQAEFMFDKIVCTSPRVIQLFPSLRMLIDKFQKTLGRIHAYEDADLYEYLEQGRNVVNVWHPATYYGWPSYPNALDTFAVMGAAWWGLNAQYLLETDMSFSFSGQTVTLDVDRTSLIEGAISRFQEFFTENLTKAKTAIVRSSSPGVVAVRPSDFSLHKRVFRMGAGFEALSPSFLDMVYSVFPRGYSRDS